MPKIPVSVNVDFTNVTQSNGQWTGTPAWTISPATAQVQPGNNKVAWTLTTVNAQGQNSVPAGFRAGFTTDGIVFKSTNLYPWNNAPVLQADGTIEASDNFQGLSQAIDYYYTTKVQLSPQAGTNGPSATFQVDPEVQNEGGNIKLAAK